MSTTARQPVLVGVGAIHQAEVAGEGLDVTALMVEAVRRAGVDCGRPDVLRRVGQVAVPSGTWTLTDPGRVIAGAIGATDARSVLVEAGIPQQTLINDALRAIAAGELDVAVVVGGEAKRRSDLARRAGIELDDADAGADGPGPDEHRRPEGEILAPPEMALRAFNAVEQYALIENARRAANGWTIDEHVLDIGELWSSWSEVGAANPNAAFGEVRTPEFLATPTPGNRPLAFPYNKWHNTQWSVDQSAALLICTSEVAEELGIPRDRWVYPSVALESSFARALTRRRDLHRWPGMAVLGRRAEEHLGRALAELDAVELYSCFPAAVRLQEAELRLDGGVHTCTGGMAFAGGPFNNAVLQATVALVQAIRESDDPHGLVTTVSGFLTKPGLAVWSTDPTEMLLHDLADEVADVTHEVELADPDVRHEGLIASYTVTYDDLEPVRVLAIVDTADGRRTMAAADDRALAATGTVDELIGRRVVVEGTEFRPC